MRRIISLFIFFIGFLSINDLHAEEVDSLDCRIDQEEVHTIFQSLKSRNLSKEAFDKAMEGYFRIVNDVPVAKRNILTIIDFNKSSKQDRFFIVDLQKRKVLHESLVAHGRNSGWDIPEQFSNQPNSYKSSLGFYLTGETYIGKHGRSLKLDGLEKGINDNARRRYIVIHQADYVSDNFVDRVGRLGRSFGCPSLPAEDYDSVINLIKDRSLIFIYSNQSEYFKKSSYL